MIGALVGLRREAQVLRRILPDAPIAISNATAEGAQRGAQRLVAAGAKALLSFGCAGGLSTSVGPGTVIVANRVQVNGCSIATDAELSERFGASVARRGGVLHSDTLIAEHAEKLRLYREFGCLAVDMESGAVARTGLPFAVLRVICDDAGKDVPSAAQVSLKDGKVRLAPLLWSIAREPRQLPDLMALGADAAFAERRMTSFLDELSHYS